MIGRTRIAGLVSAVAVLAAACGPGIVGAARNDLPLAPPVRELRPTEPVVPDDGLHRVVVTLPLAATTDSDPASVQADGVDQEFTLTVELLAGLPDGVSLVARNGQLGYQADDGTMIPLGPLSAEIDGAGSYSSAVEGKPLFDIDASVVAERLASLPGVESVSAISDTSYAVAAASLDVFESLGLAVADDGFFAFSGDPYEPYQWPLENRGDNLNQLSLPSIPDQSPDADIDGLEARTGATGAGAVVAVVDSGVDFDHPDLDGAAWVNPDEDCGIGGGNGVDDDGNGYVDDCNGWDFGHDDPVGYDGANDAHGTHVAGIMAAGADNDIGIAGLAPGAEIMDLRVDSTAGVITASAIARAIRYAADNGADIVNLSLASRPGAPAETVAEVALAADYAAEKGVLLVAAAGNNAISLDDSPVYPASLDAANMIVVAASTPDDRPTGFSNTGSPVDVFAPGELVLSTVPGDGFAFHSGTSQAAPLVAAAAALVLERQPDLAPENVARLLTSTSDGNETLSAAVAGAGRLNAAGAIGIQVFDDDTGSVIIAGLANDDDGLVTATISLGVEGGQFNQPFHWEASLIVLIGEDPHAVIGHPVSVGPTEGRQAKPGVDTVDTDRRGAVYLADKDAESATWSTLLDEGSYALVIEAVPRTDSTVRLGNAYLAKFTVSNGFDEPDDVNDDPPTDEGDGLSSDDPTTGTDSGGTNDGGGSTVGGDRGDGGPDLDTGADSGKNTSDGKDDTAGSSGGSAADVDRSGDGESGGTYGYDDLNGGSPSDVETDESSEDTSDARSEDEELPAIDSGRSEPDSTVDTGDDSDNRAIELGPDRAEDGEWRVADIEPRTGRVDTENLVQISGTFPGPVDVWFDDNPGYVEFQSSELLIVRTGRHESAGPVDVTLISRAGEPVLALPQAYAFLDDDSDVTIDIGSGEPTPGSPDKGQDPSTGDDGAGSGPDNQEPNFYPDPDEGIPVGEPPAVTNGSGSGGDDSDRGRPDDPRGRNRQARAELRGDSFQHKGLTVIALDGLSTIGAVPACNEDPCRTRRI